MPWGNYRGRPVEYASEILGEELTADQQAIARSIHEPPFMSKVDSGHSLGKSFLAAVLVNYWYDTYPDGVVVTTAPTKEHVETVLWAEVRLLRSQAH
ncbi:MAG: hypothetical protein ACJ8F7_03805, partial [Gemmataceae bacterium]